MLKFEESIEKFRIAVAGMATQPGDRFGAFRLPPGFVAGMERPLQVMASDAQPDLGVHWEHVSATAIVAVPTGRAIASMARVSAGAGVGRQMRYSTAVPTWAEMCILKDLFWEREDLVVQFHPPESEYVNNHPSVLHLWRPVGEQLPAPPSILVGFKELGEVFS